MLKQGLIYKAIISIINKVMPDLKIYSDSVKDDYDVPCSFIRFLYSKTHKTKNLNLVNISVILTYFPEGDGNQGAEFAFTDAISSIFDAGFAVDGRYLHVDSIDTEYIGSRNDILELTMRLRFYDDTVAYENKDKGYVLCKHLQLEITTD